MRNCQSIPMIRMIWQTRNVNATIWSKIRESERQIEREEKTGDNTMKIEKLITKISEKLTFDDKSNTIKTMQTTFRCSEKKAHWVRTRISIVRLQWASARVQRKQTTKQWKDDNPTFIHAEREGKKLLSQLFLFSHDNASARQTEKCHRNFSDESLIQKETKKNLNGKKLNVSVLLCAFVTLAQIHTYPHTNGAINEANKSALNAFSATIHGPKTFLFAFIIRFLASVRGFLSVSLPSAAVAVVCLFYLRHLFRSSLCFGAHEF